MDCGVGIALPELITFENGEIIPFDALELGTPIQNDCLNRRIDVHLSRHEIIGITFVHSKNIAVFEELEELLIMSDVGVQVASNLTEDSSPLELHKEETDHFVNLRLHKSNRRDLTAGMISQKSFDIFHILPELHQ